ncbi:hypothetical protein GCM10027592_60620 [Spirosoma flavus]
MNHTTELKCNLSVAAETFQLPAKAIQETQWVEEPANPTQQKGGLIRKGEIVWFAHDLFGSGPGWQQALFNDHRLGYVNQHHFAPVNEKPKT